jgi:hypothetical protein
MKFWPIALISCVMIASAGGADSVPGVLTVARTTAIPDCTVFVDAASDSGEGTAQAPHKTIAAAVKAADPGAVICVAEGTYAEQIAPAEKYFTLAGGFQSGSDFTVGDSAKYVSKAKGKGGSFIRIEDPGPQGKQLTAIDGFDISGYSRAIAREFYESQRFDVTNNYIHDNVCADQSLAGAGVALNNVSGTIKGNVFEKNSCGRGGALFLNDAKNENKVSVENNRVDGNAGTEPGAAHGGAFYLFGNTLTITGNEFTNNSVTQWGGGLYIGAYTEGNQPTTATLSRNVYRSNRAGDAGGGFFCDDGATCIASHEIYDRNCGGNILVDGGSRGSGPTTTRFDHITNVGALGPGCEGPGDGVLVDNYEAVAPDSHTFSNAIFWGNAEGRDFAAACSTGCNKLKVSVTYSMVQTKYADGSVKITFGPGNIAPADPLFVAPDNGNFRLQAGSPAIGKGNPGGTQLGAYGGEAAEETAPARVAEAPAKEKAASEPNSKSASEAEAANEEEVSAEDAFKSAKELGTSEAWEAFLASYPTGFHADLARAYLKKLNGKTPAASPATAAGAGKVQEVSCSEQSKLRAQKSDVSAIVTFVNASGMHRSILSIDSEGGFENNGGLEPGERLTVETFVSHPWMIATGPGDCLQIFLPNAGLSTVELGPMPADNPKATEAKQPPKNVPLVCAKNYKLRNGECVIVQNCGKNAYRSDEGDCYCKKNYEMRDGNCVWKQDKKGFEVKPWEKPGCTSWQAPCSQGNNKACGQYEANCQVN